MNYGMRLSAFSERSPDITFDLPPSNDHLLERASIRASVFYPNQFSLISPSQRGMTDVVYASRDVPDRNSEQRAFDTAFMVHQWSSWLPLHREILNLLTKWTTFEGVSEPLDLHYSKDWLHPSFPDIFLSAYDQCRGATKMQVFQLVFTLASVSYGSHENDTLISTLLACATVPEVRNLTDPPTFASYDLSDGFIPCDVVLRKLITSCAIDFDCSQERRLVAKDGEDEIDLGRRRFSAFEARCDSEKETILREVNDAWPCEEPPTLDTLEVTCYKLGELSGKLRPIFRSCWANHLLKQHLDDLQGILNQFYVASPPSKLPSQYHLNPHFDCVASPSSSVDAQWLFNRLPPAPRAPGTFTVLPNITQRNLSFLFPNSELTTRLQKLVINFRDRGSNKFHHKYADDLNISTMAFCTENVSVPLDPVLYITDTDFLLEHYRRHSVQFYESLRAVEAAISPAVDAESALYNAGLWPRVTPNFLFSHMASISGNHLGRGWRTALIRLSQTLLRLQRSRRLLVFAANKSWVEFSKELENEECEGFDPESYPDWLLIQVHFCSKFFNHGR